MFSDFIWDFGKLPFPTHLGKYFIKIGKIRAKIHEIGKIKAIFWIGNDSHIWPQKWPNKITDVLGTQKNRLNETVLLSTQNMLKLMGKKLFTILR